MRKSILFLEDIPALLEVYKGNQRAVAEHKKVSQATISRWLKENGYMPRVEWVKMESDREYVEREIAQEGG